MTHEVVGFLMQLNSLLVSLIHPRRHVWNHFWEGNLIHDILVYYLSLLLSKALYLNNLFTFGGHFQTKRFLIKHWWKTKKRRTTKAKKWKWFRLKSPSHPKSGLPVNQAHLSTFAFTQLSTTSVCFTEQNVLVAKLNAGCKIESSQSVIHDNIGDNTGWFLDALASLKPMLVPDNHRIHDR